VPRVLSLADAVPWALEHNTALAALRQQHGIAAAAVVVARTYPFNPLWEGKIRGVNGPVSATITNRVSQEYKLLWEVEVRGQGGHRRQAAAAALSRTDWEIVSQEVALAVHVARAFDAVLYRREKLRLVEETVRVNEGAAEAVRRLVDEGRLRGADWVVARGDLGDARAQLSPTRSALVSAWSELVRTLGWVGESFTPEGTLDTPPGRWDAAALTQAALGQRADLHAREAAVAEADARLRLEVANRYGNPNVGSDYEYGETRANHIGTQIAIPFPVFNTHQGEILQRKAERERAALELQNAEAVVRQDVQAALARLDEARRGADFYRDRVLPDLQAGLKQLERLYLQGDPGADLPRVTDFRRKLLKARDGYLDALWELRQAQADLAAAVGDPALAVCPPAQANGPAVPEPGPSAVNGRPPGLSYSWVPAAASPGPGSADGIPRHAPGAAPER
jgi:outer membrane protein TolC